MAKEQPYPTKIQKISPELVRVFWSDEHQGDYPVVYLRKRCPCAGCSVEIRKQSLPVLPDNMPEKLELKQVTAMGNYAVGFHFNDGHTTGIYSYEYLRDICPCKQCTKASSLGSLNADLEG